MERFRGENNDNEKRTNFLTKHMKKIKIKIKRLNSFGGRKNYSTQFHMWKKKILLKCFCKCLFLKLNQLRN